MANLISYAVILAGGYGTRFWPLSRRARPKQFLPLAPPSAGLADGEGSLLQLTYRRVERLFPPGRIFVVGNAEHERLLRRQLPRLPRGRLLLEPVGRNTAAACALAAEHIRASLPTNQPDAVLGVFPADHAIRDQARFRRLVRAALAAAAAEEVMVVLGVPPTHPDTGYGYIERGGRLGRLGGESLYIARRFTEKPDARTAARYLGSRRYFWNSGMFFWRLSTFDRLLARHLPDTWAALEKLSAAINQRDYPARLRRIYPGVKSISVDYALAEPAAARGQVRLLPAQIGWSDVGSWSAAFDWLGQSRARGGKSLTGAEVLALGSRGNFVVVPEGKFVATLGVNDLVIVDSPRALLVCARDRAQEVRKVVDYLSKKKRKRLL